MIVGVPKEIKADEYRVAMIPVGVEELTRARAHRADRGRGRAGQRHHRRAVRGGRRRDRRRRPPTIWARADLIVKVKEPLPPEWPLTAAGPDRLHLLPLRRRRGADPGGASTAGITAIAYETIRDAAGQPAAADADERGRRPDEHPGGGEVPRAAPGRARHPAGGRARACRRPTSSILGGGVVGANAAKVAAGLGANVTHPRHQPRPAALPRRRHAAERHHALFSDRHNILEVDRAGRPASSAPS